jgi:hypothetical protein
MDRLDQLFQQFLRERTYINNVTPATREWYECARKALTGARGGIPERPASAPLLSKAEPVEDWRKWRAKRATCSR